MKTKPFEVLSYRGLGTGTIYTLDEKGSTYVSKDGLIADKALIKNIYAFGMHTVVNRDGNVLMIGDTVVSMTKDAYIKDPMTIQGFRMNNAGDGICAITNHIMRYGIGIDKLEHYLAKQPKQLDCMERARKDYPIGTKIISVGGMSCIVFSEPFTAPEYSDNTIYVLDEFNFTRIIWDNSRGNHYWAEIVKN